LEDVYSTPTGNQCLRPVTGKTAEENRSVESRKIMKMELELDPWIEELTW
jgi:hypothetical protein